MTNDELHAIVDDALVRFGLPDEPSVSRPAIPQRRYVPTPTSDTMAPAAWTLTAVRLADAVLGMANREDACGGYRWQKPTTRKDTDADWLPLRDALIGHFAGHRTIGLHASTPDNWCRWIAFDIDAHNGEDAARNLDAAETIAKSLGGRCHIFDSDGRGGLHVWHAFVSGATPTDVAYRLAQATIEGLNVKVETFPKSPEVRPGGYGNWIRLPGHHHKRDHWSRVWTPDGWGSHQQTIDAILELAQWVATPS